MTEKIEIKSIGIYANETCGLFAKTVDDELNEILRINAITFSLRFFLGHFFYFLITGSYLKNYNVKFKN